jgi:uncharacterized tellurite resistance protein B-like protein
MKRSIGSKIGDLVYAVSGIDYGRNGLPANRETENAVASVLALAAMSDKSVSTEETERLVVILRKGFALEGGAALSLITRAIHDLPVHSSMGDLLVDLNRALGIRDKEDLVVMLLEVIAADGHKEAEEMEVLAHTVYGLNVSDKSLQRAYRRYFASRRGRADRKRSGS